MTDNSCIPRRMFLLRAGPPALGWPRLPDRAYGHVARGPARLPRTWHPWSPASRTRRFAGVEAAIAKNLLPAATEHLYPGYFNISADGDAYGGATWPGLDSWQMAGAYLLLGRTRLVLDYFEFVRASQRKDGNIPFAIFSGDTRPAGFLSGLKSPDDIFTYKPPKREGLPASSQVARSWIGLFEHWQPKANPLSTLGPVCYILTGSEIFDAASSLPWLRERLPSIEAAAKHLLSRKSENGLIAGSGFYLELPPRYAWDGVTQCYVIHAFREVAQTVWRCRRQDKRSRLVRPGR